MAGRPDEPGASTECLYGAAAGRDRDDAHRRTPDRQVGRPPAAPDRRHDQLLGTGRDVDSTGHGRAVCLRDHHRPGIRDVGELCAGHPGEQLVPQAQGRHHGRHGRRYRSGWHSVLARVHQYQSAGQRRWPRLARLHAHRRGTLRILLSGARLVAGGEQALRRGAADLRQGRCRGGRRHRAGRRGSGRTGARSAARASTAQRLVLAVVRHGHIARRVLRDGPDHPTLLHQSADLSRFRYDPGWPEP